MNGNSEKNSDFAKYSFIIEICGFGLFILLDRKSCVVLLGAQLDTLGDVALYALVLFVFFSKTNLFDNTIALSLFALILVSKLINQLVTRIKFKQWNIIHTTAYKIIGGILFFSVPCFYIFPEFSLAFVFVLCIVAQLAAIEEFIILLTTKKYNVNRKSIFYPSK